jgi:hypothetical protein
VGPGSAIGIRQILRLPKSLHAALASEREGASLNRLFVAKQAMHLHGR